MTRPSTRLIAIPLACLLLQTSTHAGTALHTSGTGNWSSAATWSSTPAGFVPNNGNNGEDWTATVSTGTATMDSAVIIDGLIFSGGTINGSSTVTVNDSLSYTGGTLSSGGGTLISDGTLSITANGQSILGGKLTNNGDATLAVGSGSLVLRGTLTNSATGTFTVNNATNVSLTASTFSGEFVNAGILNKSGAGTFFLTSGVDLDNTGTVNVSAGLLTISGGSLITQHSGATLTGGAWNVSGTGGINVTTGSSITTLGSAASVTLDGAGSSFSKISTLTSNQGSFTLKNNHDFNTGGTFTNSGTLTVQDSTTALTVGGGGAYTQTAGNTSLVAGGTIVATAFNLNGGSLTGTGTISGNVSTANTTTISPGASAGVITVNGSTILGSGNTLVMQIGGLGSGVDYDVLDVNGALTLAGLLDIDFIDGFESSVLPGDVFYIATANSAIGGVFSNVASGGYISTNFAPSFQVFYGLGSPYGSENLVLANAVPEPGRAMFACLGLLGVWGARRRSGHPADLVKAGAA